MEVNCDEANECYCIMHANTIRIILVDDHQLVRETWRMLLQSLPGLEVIGECASGEEAIEQVPALLPDVVLMDINMSPVNGFEATRKIMKTCPQVRIIGVSVNSQPGYARNMLQLGAKGYVTKNSSPAEMLRAIEAVCSGKIYVCDEVRQGMLPEE
jgi:two-component system invasion response regulator UvrY